MKNYSGITYKYLGIQKKRTILTLLGIILSVALITSIGTMVYSLQDKMLRDAIRYNGEYHAVFKDVPGSMADKIMKHVDVETCSVTRSRGFAAIAKVEGQKGSSQEGLPPYRYLDIEDYDDNSYSMLPKITLKEGRLPENSNEIAVDYWVLNYLPGHPRLGDKIKLDIGIREDKESHDQLDDRSWSGNEEFIKKNQREYTLTGLVNPIVSWPGGFVSHGYSKLDDNLDTKSNYNVYVKMNSSIGIHDSIVAIAKDLGLTSVNGSYSQVKFNDQVLRYLGQSADSVLNRGMLLVLLFVVILIMVCTIAVIYNIFHISVLERISQFGILRCTGASPGQIRRIVLKEAAVMSVIGIPTGLALGLLAMKVVMLIIGGLGFGLDSTFDLRVFVSIPVLVISTVLGLITIFAAAFGPARQAARVSPLEAVRNTGNFKKENFSKVKRLRLSKKFLKIEGQIAFKNLRRNRKRFRITVFSMVISIILYIVFGNFIGYIFDIGAVQGDMGTDFRATISGGTGEGFTDEQYNTVKALPGVEAVYKFINTYLTVVAPENIINPALK
ncbi:MAG: FtsX-like permease family protein, partial [Bacillota bacterium]|nr:FtsX-like permease family protein [Bacillota bacterium]